MLPEYGRHIERNVRNKLERGVVGEVKPDIALHRDGAGIEDAVRNYDRSASVLVHVEYRKIYCLACKDPGVSGHSAEIRNADAVFREFHPAHVFNYPVGLRPWIAAGQNSGAASRDEHECSCC